MGAAMKKDYSIQEYETRYFEITRLYDFAEELLATVDSGFAKDSAAQLALVEPLIHEIGEATDVLAEEFIFTAESYRYPSKSKSSKAHIEAALRRVFAAIADYQERVRGLSKKAHGAITNIADPIVIKIQRQVEEVVVIFLEFVHLSLHSIMGQAMFEAFTARDARVALLMHQQAMQQQ